jgi:hypothetical protein
MPTWVQLQRLKVMGVQQECGNPHMTMDEAREQIRVLADAVEQLLRYVQIKTQD